MVQLQRVSGWHDILCALLEQGKPFSTACAFANIPASRVYNEMKLDPVFEKRVKNAEKAGRGEGGPGEGAGVVTNVRLAPVRK
jgi:hypothetical protein